MRNFTAKMPNFKFDHALNSLADWSAVCQISIIVLLCCSLSGLVYWFDLRPQQQVTRQAIQMSINLRAARQVSQHKLTQTLHAQKRLQREQLQIRQLSAALPTRAALPTLLEALAKLSTADGLQLYLFKPSASESWFSFAAETVQIVLRGTYQQLNKFIERLATTNQPTALEKFSITPCNLTPAMPTWHASNATDCLTLQVWVKVYYTTINEPVTLLRAVASVSNILAPTPATNPFSPNVREEPSTEHASVPLEKFPLATLRLVGILVDDTVAWGLILAPDARVYVIKSGENLGQQGARVCAIQRHSIDIAEPIGEGVYATKHYRRLLLGQTLNGKFN